LPHVIHQGVTDWFYVHGTVTNQWDPLTLKGAGLFHIAMGTVLGITAYGRTQEKLSGVIPNNLASTQNNPITTS